MRNFLAAVMLLAGTALPAAGKVNADSPFVWLNSYVGQTYVLRTSVNGNPYVYLPIIEDLATLEMRGKLFPLMGPERITIVDVALDIDDAEATMRFTSAHQEDGVLRFIAPRNSVETMGQRHVDALLGLVTEDNVTAPHVLNAATNMLHFKGSNHSRGFPFGAEYHEPQAALDDGHTLCASCFAPIHLLPGYEDELALGRLVSANVRDNCPVVTDDAIQTRVREIGHKVLQNWPLPLRGYQYRFTVVEAPAPNAVACPGGWIFVYEGLVRLCESDLELEAVLAHEISHVEMRHGLRQLRSAQKAARIGAMVGAVVAGVAATQGNSTTAAVAAGIGALIVNTATELALAGYSRDMEMESDAAAVNYLVGTAGLAERGHLARMLAKLEYYEQCETGYQSTYDATWHHPPSAVRADFAANAETRFFAKPITFNVATDDGAELELEINGICHHAYYNPTESTSYDDLTAYEFGFNAGSAESMTSDGFHSDTRIFGSLRADMNIDRGREIKNVQVLMDDTWITFDNKEDTALYPGSSISVVFSHRQKGRVEFQSLIPTGIRYSGRVTKASSKADAAQMVR